MRVAQDLGTTLRWFLPAMALVAMVPFAYVVWLLSRSEVLPGRLECESPDHQYVATLYTVGGGGAAGWTMNRVSVRRVGEPLKKDRYVFEADNLQNLRISWLGTERLQIVHYGNVDVYEATRVAAGGAVEIAYERAARSEPLPVVTDSGICQPAN